MRKVHIIGVPLDLGGNRRGTDMGPSAFRIAGIGEQLASLGLAVTSHNTQSLTTATFDSFTVD